MPSYLSMPIWECISDEALLKLIKYQWETYGTRPDLLKPFPEIESPAQLEKLMKQKPESQRLVK